MVTASVAFVSLATERGKSCRRGSCQLMQGAQARIEAAAFMPTSLPMPHGTNLVVLGYREVCK